MFLNGVQTAWKKAIEKKLGTEVTINEDKDLRLLAKLATGNSKAKLVKEIGNGESV